MISKADETTVPYFKESIHKAVDEYNESSGKPYELSVAIGGDLFETVADGDFLKKIDELMYLDKNEYYKCHDRRRR